MFTKRLPHGETQCSETPLIVQDLLVNLFGTCQDPPGAAVMLSARMNRKTCLQ
jgi:hypothetical protein